MQELLAYAYQNCDVTIVEGILRYEWYKSLFETALQLYGRDYIFAYYYDLSFEETLLRHQTKINRQDFGKEEMRTWWKEKDYLGIIPENIITFEMSVEDVISQILSDIDVKF